MNELKFEITGQTVSYALKLEIIGEIKSHAFKFKIIVEYITCIKISNY